MQKKQTNKSTYTHKQIENYLGGITKLNASSLLGFLLSKLLSLKVRPRKLENGYQVMAKGVECEMKGKTR